MPATSANLGPGFDILGIALRLYNEVRFDISPDSWTRTRRTPKISLSVRGDGARELPRDASNLVLCAAGKLFDQVKRWPSEIAVQLTNGIPLSRGLGSSSAAIVGGLCAANALLNRPLTNEEILHLATDIEGHPDNVTPALMGGFCISGVWQGETRFLKFAVPSGLRAVVCSPDRPLATKAARGVLPSRIPFADAVFTSSRVAFLIGALLQRRYDWLGDAMADVLHQPARSRLIPGLNEVIARARQAGAYGAALSGAGSSVIALTKPASAERVGRAMEKAFAEKGVISRWQSLVLSNTGAESV